MHTYIAYYFVTVHRLLNTSTFSLKIMALCTNYTELWVGDGVRECGSTRRRLPRP